jgi:hypothetical protein
VYLNCIRISYFTQLKRRLKGMLRILTKNEYESLPEGAIKCIGLCYGFCAPAAILVDNKILISIEFRVLPDDILHPNQALSCLLYQYHDIKETSSIPMGIELVNAAPPCLPSEVSNTQLCIESLEGYLFSSLPENKLKGVSMLLDFDVNECFLVTSKYEEYSHICPPAEEVKVGLKWSEIREIVNKNQQLFVDAITKRLQDLSFCNITGSSKCFGDYGLDISMSFFVYFTIDM